MSLNDTIEGNLETDLDWEKIKSLAIFLLPGLSLFGIFAVGPMVYSLVGSFFAWDTWTMGNFVGLENWINTLTNPLIINVDNLLSFTYPMGALPQNIIWMVIHVPLSTLIGLGLALLFNNLRGRRILRPMIFLGFTTPAIVIGLVLLFIYDPEAGLFNAFLRAIGQGDMVRNWLQEPQLAIYGLVAGGIWIQTGFSMILYSSALASIDQSLIESGRIDGAGAIRRFTDIIWPMVKPVTAVVVIMQMIWVLRIFAIVYAAGGPSGGPNHVFSVLGLEVYRAAFSIPVEYGRAMVVALIELVMAVPLAVYIARME